MNMRVTRFAVALALMAALALSAAVTAAAKKPKAERKTLRVLYWNIQNGMWDGQGDNYDRFVAWISKKNPDICIFCEASTIFNTDTTTVIPKDERYLPDHWGELCARWGHSYWFKSAQRDNYPQVVTSRFPIDSLGGFVGIKPDSLIQHAAGWCQVRVDGLPQPLNIVTCHPKPFSYGYHVPKEKQAESSANYEGEKFRRREVEFICNHTVRTHPNASSEYWIMAADYNSISRKDNFKYRYGDASMSFLTQDYMLSDKTPYYDIVAEVYPGLFCPSCGKNTRIDFFYVTKPLLNACKDVFTQTDSYTARVKTGLSNFYRPSDHFPIIVDFDMSKLK